MFDCKKILLLSLVLSFGIGCDQTSKRIAEHTLSGSLPYSFFYDSIRLQFIKNSGAFLSFGSQFPESVKFWLFIIFPIFLLSGFILLLLTSKNLTLKYVFMFALIISGGLGNLIDRIFLDGRVTDFINVGIGSFRTGIFNIADLLIMAGAIGLIFLQVFRTRTEKRHDYLV